MSRRNRKADCNKFRRGKDQQVSNFRVIEGGASLSRARKREVEITPKGFNQCDLLGHLRDSAVDITLAVGPAGTGKTMISTLVGIDMLKKGEVDRLVITRPAVSVDEQHGFLPGTLVEKMAPWVIPIMSLVEEYYTPDQIEYMLKDGKIEIAPFAYMRGRTFHNSFIIADECQLTTPNQMKMLLTRIGVGEGSKLVVTGDLDQADRGSDNGLRDFLARLEGKQSDRIKLVRFNGGDIQRHPVVAEVLELYK
jgi:phosphate starvation-inducible protein PhoH and related proteins